MSEKKLTDKQKLFCKHYLILNDATKAAIAAGYSKKTAASIGHENLRKPEIAEEINKTKQKIHEKLDLTPERVLKEFAKYGFTESEAVEIKDRLKALENVGKILGAYNKDESGKNIIKVKVTK